MLHLRNSTWNLDGRSVHLRSLHMLESPDSCRIIKGIFDSGSCQRGETHPLGSGTGGLIIVQPKVAGRIIVASLGKNRTGQEKPEE